MMVSTQTRYDIELVLNVSTSRKFLYFLFIFKNMRLLRQ